MARRVAVGILLILFLALTHACGAPLAEPTASPTGWPSEDPSKQSATASATRATAGPTSVPATRTGTPIPTPTLEPWRGDLPEECPGAGSGTVELTSEGPGQGVAGIFEGQIRDYLNARGGASGLAGALRPLTLLDGTWQARAQVETTDLTGNSVPEVLVELTFFEPLQFSEGALFVYRCAGGEFAGGAVLTTAGQVLSADDPDGIRAVRDMNKDGRPEIVHSYISIAGSHAFFSRQFRILEWNGQGFDDLIPIDVNGFAAQVESGDGAVRDQDGDGTLELILSNAVAEAYPDLGPQRARTDIWQWDGEAFVLARWEYTRPVFRIHAIWDGDDATRFGDYEQALAFYQDAVFNEQLAGWSLGRLWPDSAYGSAPTPMPDRGERHRLDAYGRYRILLLHVAQGNQAEAQVVYDALLGLFPEAAVGRQFVDLATSFWTEYSASGDLTQACGKAIDFAESHDSTVLSPLGKDFYGLGQREYQPEDICPLGG